MHYGWSKQPKFTPGSAACAGARRRARSALRDRATQQPAEGRLGTGPVLRPDGRQRHFASRQAPLALNGTLGQRRRLRGMLKQPPRWLATAECR